LSAFFAASLVAGLFGIRGCRGCRFEFGGGKGCNLRFFQPKPAARQIGGTAVEMDGMPASICVDGLAHMRPAERHHAWTSVMQPAMKCRLSNPSR
jgi:hypothetical protein